MQLERAGYALHRGRKMTYESGSENIFTDLIIANADEKLAKAGLALKTNRLLNAGGFKQAKTAKLLEID